MSKRDPYIRRYEANQLQQALQWCGGVNYITNPSDYDDTPADEWPYAVHMQHDGTARVFSIAWEPHALACFADAFGHTMVDEDYDTCHGPGDAYLTIEGEVLQRVLGVCTYPEIEQGKAYDPNQGDLFDGTNDERSGASISVCEKYRYTLWRTWDASKPRVCFVGLNPSTADATTDDPTIRRCLGYAHRWGMGGLTMLNLFSYRATDPGELLQLSLEQAQGDQGPATLAAYSKQPQPLFVLCWGASVGMRDDLLRYAHRVGQNFAELGTGWCLGKTKGGQPRHPLYLPKTADLIPYEANA